MKKCSFEEMFSWTLFLHAMWVELDGSDVPDLCCISNNSKELHVPYIFWETVMMFL